MMHKTIFLVFSLFLLSCSEPEPRKPILRKSSSFLKESIKRNKIINKIEEKALSDFMKKDTIHTYFTSEKGFWYYYHKKNTNQAQKLPIKGDRILYTYRIEDVNGKLLYSENAIGNRSYHVEKQEIISGLQDGLKLLKEGEHVTFLFPSYKAYGYSGYKKINGNQPLVFTVKINEIINQK